MKESKILKACQETMEDFKNLECCMIAKESEREKILKIIKSLREKALSHPLSFHDIFKGGIIAYERAIEEIENV